MNNCITMACLNISITELTHRMSVSASLVCSINLKYNYLLTEDGYFLTNEGFRFRILKS